MDPEKIVIENDDDALAIIEKVNVALVVKGFKFEMDDGKFDGYQPYTLVRLQPDGEAL